MRITSRGKENLSLPLPVWSSVHIADAVSQEGEDFEIFIGLEKRYAQQLKNYSLDKGDIDLQKNTGDFKRFGLGSYEEWYEKGRTPFSLIHKKTDTLAALAWFGLKPLGEKSIKFGSDGKENKKEDAWHTIAFRSYVPWRGKGLMKDFAEFTIREYGKHYPGVKFCTGMDKSNEAVVRLVTKLGFKIDEKASDLGNNWLVMTRD